MFFEKTTDTMCMLETRQICTVLPRPNTQTDRETTTCLFACFSQSITARRCVARLLDLLQDTRSVNTHKAVLLLYTFQSLPSKIR